EVIQFSTLDKCSGNLPEVEPDRQPSFEADAPCAASFTGLIFPGRADHRDQTKNRVFRTTAGVWTPELECSAGVCLHDPRVNSDPSFLMMHESKLAVASGLDTDEHERHGGNTAPVADDVVKLSFVI